MTNAEQLLEANRHQAHAQLRAGLASHQTGDLAAARKAYGTALSMAPDDPLALGLMGSLEAMEGNAASAVHLLEKSAQLAPDNASTCFNLGLQLRKLNRPADALRWFRQALALQPGTAAYLFQQADTLDSIGTQREREAAWLELLVACEQDLARAPLSSAARFHCGVALLHLDLHEEALGILNDLAAEQPDRADIQLRRAQALSGLKRFEDALRASRMAVEIDPDAPLVDLNLGNAFLNLEDHAQAIAVFRRLLHRNPEDVAARFNLGTALQRSGQPAQALQEYDRAVKLRPDSGDFRMARAYCLLAMGHFEQGWAEHEHRLRQPTVPWKERDFGCLAWSGDEDLEGRTILVWAEQGLGDTIQFSRYASELGRLGARVILEVHPPLVGLLQSLAHVSAVLPFMGCLEKCDYHCALMSLPHLLGRSTSHTAARGAYLRPHRDLVARWAACMQSGPNVGIAWSGNARHQDDHRRSIPFQRMRAHLDSDIRWWCVQKDVRASDALFPGPECQVVRPPLGDFDDTAGLLANLDAVVTVDTSVAHLAGALGCPTLLLLPHAAEWRWELDRTRSPWYESVHLFRQVRCGDWDSALREAMLHLEVLQTGR